MNNLSKLRAGILLVGGFGLALIVGVAFGPMFAAPPRSKAPKIAPSNTNAVKAARPHVRRPGGYWPNQAHVKNA